MAEISDVHLVAVALRTCASDDRVDVTMAMDRLILPPQSLGEVKQTLEDLQLVKDFIRDRIPQVAREPAMALFVEHAEYIKKQMARIEGKH